MLPGRVRVPHRRPKIGVAERLFHLHDVAPLGKPRRHAAMTQIMLVKRRKLRALHQYGERTPERLDPVARLVLPASGRVMEHPGGRVPSYAANLEAAKWSRIAATRRGVIGTHRPLPDFVRC